MGFGYKKKSSGGWKDKKGGGYRGGRDDKKTMHSAKCSKCHATCRLPFKPNGRKPVFCSDCFVHEGDGGRGGRLSFDGNDKPAYRSTPRSADNGEVVKQLKALNDKMEKLLKVLTEVAEYEEEGGDDDGGDEMSFE